jgi:hypothetical protein
MWGIWFLAEVCSNPTFAKIVGTVMLLVLGSVFWASYEDRHKQIPKGSGSNAQVKLNLHKSHYR